MARRPYYFELVLIKDELFQRTAIGDWKTVAEKYEAHPEIHKAVNKSGDTALHIAVLDGQEREVQKLVKLICDKDGSKEALGIANESGHTPLHLAAASGSVRMCECIAKENVRLIGRRNVGGETPLFLAALHGKKDAFLCLSSIYGDEGRRPYYWRRNDGDTILHVAISGDYFELANEIINYYNDYNDFLYGNNDQGLSPLHLLAGKPSAFRSGSHLGRLNQIIYHCIFVDTLRKSTIHHRSSSSFSSGDKSKHKYPSNYHTCWNFVGVLACMFGLTAKGPWKKNERSDVENPAQGYAQGHELFPPNYGTCFGIIKLVLKAMLVILGSGSRNITKLREIKQKHTWSVEIMNKLFENSKTDRYEDNGGRPKRSLPGLLDGETKLDGIDSGTGDNDDVMIQSMIGLPPDLISEDGNKILEPSHQLAKDQKRRPGMGTHETPILIAAKNGITEIVQKILEDFPAAVHDVNSDKKNIVLLAAENKQPRVFKLLLKRIFNRDIVFRSVDKDGNSALHLAAMLGKHRPWQIPGPAFQMQWELKWYEFVKDSMPPHINPHNNNCGMMPDDVFTDTHKDLVKDGREWLTKIAESCLVVVAVVTTVAFTTYATVPGGIKQESGAPTLGNRLAFDIFAFSSLLALCFSVTSLVMCLAILMSRYQLADFRKDLPRKLFAGLTLLFASIAAMLISFCAGHFFIIKDKLKYAAFPIYAITCLVVPFFAIGQLPLYLDLIWANFKIPQRA